MLARQIVSDVPFDVACQLLVNGAAFGERRWNKGLRARDVNTYKTQSKQKWTEKRNIHCSSSNFALEVAHRCSGDSGEEHATRVLV